MSNLTAATTPTTTEAMVPTVEELPPRILVALDASPNSRAALQAAAHFAAALDAELHGLFIEDDRLLRLCDSPFSREVSVLTAVARPLESLDVERKLKIMAAELRRMLAHVAADAQVQWSFQVRRGAVEQELLAEAEHALLLSLGRTNWLARRGLGSTARNLIKQTMRPLLLLGQRDKLNGPLTLLYNGSTSAERALLLAAQLTRHAAQPLTIFMVGTENTIDTMLARIAQQFQGADRQPHLVVIDADKVHQEVVQNTTDALILPVDYVDLIVEISGPILLVP